jgi:hypothetical protein
LPEQSRRIAHEEYSKFSGWVIITHPFHPLCGLQFQAINLLHPTRPKKLLLVGVGNNFFIPRDWTDQAHPQSTDILNRDILGKIDRFVSGKKVK